MGDFNEYVFCPYCGGITAPGICVNCGMSTTAQKANTNTSQTNDIMQESGQPTEQEYSKYQPQSQPAVQEYSKYQPQSQPTEQEYSKYQPQNQPTEQEYSKYQPQNQPAEQEYSKYQPQSKPAEQEYGQYQQVNEGAAQIYNQVQQNNVQYQQPNMSYTYHPPKKKTNWWIWLLLIGLILFFGGVLVVIAIIAALAVYGNTSSISSGTSTQYQISSMPTVTVPETPDIPDAYDTSTETVYERELGRLDFSNFDWEACANSALVYSDTSDGSKDIFLAKDYESTFGSNHDNHSMNEFTGDYYEPFVDCIDTSYDYSLSRHFISYSNVQNDVIVNASIAYIQLEGDTVPNEDEINQQILEMTANDLWGYLDGQKDFGYGASEVTFMIDSFIPYNDGEKMSILLDVNIYDDGYQNEHYIYAINIDLINGEIMNNASILEIDEDFAAMFRERNNAQNGSDVVGVINADDEEIAELLSNADTNIIFFSPYGMEIGYNYQTTNYSWGWVSITLSDYEDYLN